MKIEKSQETQTVHRGEPDLYMLVRQGYVLFDSGVRKGKHLKFWTIADTLEDAKRYALWCNCGASPALIGSAPGETFLSQLAIAIEEGCGAVACVRGWNIDGSPSNDPLHFHGHTSPVH